MHDWKAKSARGSRRCALKPSAKPTSSTRSRSTLRNATARRSRRRVSGRGDALGARPVPSQQCACAAHRRAEAGARARRRHGGRLHGSPARGSLARPALRRARVRQAARLRGHGRPDPRARHRRDDGDLQRRLLGADQTSAVPERRRAREAPAQLCGPVRRCRLRADDVRHVPRREPDLRRHRFVAGGVRDADRRRRARSGCAPFESRTARCKRSASNRCADVGSRRTSTAPRPRARSP